jgi:hypothetical protein
MTRCVVMPRDANQAMARRRKAVQVGAFSSSSTST